MPEFTVTLKPPPPEISRRVYALMVGHHPHLSPDDIALYVTDRAPQESNALIVADTDLAAGQHGSASFVIWFALDYWATQSDNQRDAMADHELCHCAFDDAGEPALLEHDITEFNAVIARYGLWWAGGKRTLEALKEMPPKVEE